ncbi:MAG TPA: SIMPL domain-containing protein [Candidatus Limnocylindria bacterium]|jgi:uncharacterized protein YggE|nr:SIMPL domain-containing protein [Candidatus Limnocylindria bacterium]
MRTFTLAATALAVLAALAPAAAQTTAQTTAQAAFGPTLTVTGRASVDRMPDEAVVAFAIITDDANAGRATSANNTAYNTLVTRLGGLGLGPSALKTTGFDVAYNPRPAQPNPQFAQRYGYVVTRSVSVTTTRTDQVGAVIDAAVAAGVTNVNTVTFGLHDRSGAYRAALGAAVADAQDQAHALADAAHVRLGRIQRISPIGPVVPGPRPLNVAFSRVAPAAPPVPTEVQPSDLSVQASVTITYQIAP